MSATAPAVAVAAYGLSGAGVDLPAGPLPLDAWDDLVAALRRVRVTWPLAAAIRDGRLAASPRQVEEAEAAHRDALCLDLLLERQLVSVADQFDAAGIDLVVLKGPAAAHLDYPDPAMRSFGDLDILVRTGAVGAAIRLLEAEGGRRRYAEPRPGYDERFSKGASVRMPLGHEVDVHRTLAPGPFGLTIDLGRLFEGTATFALGSRQLLALGPAPRFVHACVHAALGDAPPSLRAVRDVAQLLGRELDDAAVLGLAADWRVEAVVALAIRTAVATFRLELASPLLAWAAGHEAAPADRRRLAAYTARRSSAAQAIESLRVIPGTTDRLRYLVSILLPRPAPSRRPAAERWRRGLRYLSARG